MLIQLNIANFALIDQLELNFQEGFTVFTGETGSGKSILLGALNLILGERADYGVIRDQEQKTVVEGRFKLGAYHLQDFFQENDLDYADESIIRREITAQGKSRAFVNDTPVSLQILKELSERLIHIHSQHHTLELRSAEFQTDVLDYLTDSIALRQTYVSTFRNWKLTQKALRDKQETLKQLERDADYIRFQVRELESLELDRRDYASLERDLDQAENMDQIKAAFEALYHQLGGDLQLLDQMAALKQQLDKTAALHPELEALHHRLTQVYLELKDIGYEAGQVKDKLQADPEQKFALEQLVSAFLSALSKHHAANQAELLQIYERFKAQDLQTDQLQDELAALALQDQQLEIALREQGAALNASRIAGKDRVAQEMIVVLEQLKMPGTKLSFEINTLDTPGESGYDQISLLFSPNAGMAPKPIEKTASGGELSRLMLVIQLLLSAKKQLPSLVFDEIDTGVSGEVAQKLGLLLQQMGSHHQVWAITHLPQVAARGNQHFKVLKTAEQQQTMTRVEQLNPDQRVEEIARLMSGEEIGQSARDHARSLLHN